MLNGSEAGGNRYYGYPAYSTLYDTSQSFYHFVRGFHPVTAIGSKVAPSSDLAYLYDSSGNDTFDEAFLEDGKHQGGFLTDSGGTYANWIKYFDLVYARSSDSGTEDTIAVEDEELLAYRKVLRHLRHEVAGRHQPVEIDEPVRVGSLGRLDQEHRDVHGDEQVIDDRRGACRDVVTKRNHTP